MTEPEYSFPPEPTRPGRRRVLAAVVVAWVVVLGGLAVWSVRHDPATVSEQRTIAQALPELQQAAGVVFAAAGGPGRAVVLGALQVAERCRVTPVRDGLIAARDITIYVRSGSARTDTEAIATALPAAYRAEVSGSRGGTRFAFHADAGNFIGIDASSDAGTRTVTLRLTSGCRPTVTGALDRADPPAAPAPAAFGAVLAAVGAKADGTTVQSVTCAGGGTAGTYTVDGIPAPQDLATSLRAVVSGATVISSSADGWAYRTGRDSVVVAIDDDGRLRVSASSDC